MENRQPSRAQSKAYFDILAAHPRDEGRVRSRQLHHLGHARAVRALIVDRKLRRGDASPTADNRRHVQGARRKAEKKVTDKPRGRGTPNPWDMNKKPRPSNLGAAFCCSKPAKTIAIKETPGALRRAPRGAFLTYAIRPSRWRRKSACPGPILRRGVRAARNCIASLSDRHKTSRCRFGRTLRTTPRELACRMALTP